MASQLAILRQLKLSQLRHVAAQTGINSSGTKSILTNRLLAELPVETIAPVPRHQSHEIQPCNGSVQPKNSVAKSCRVISIDMGIRNLAYCVFSLSAFSACKADLSKKPGKCKFVVPTVVAWERTTINQDVRVPSVKSGSVEVVNKDKEAFDPSTYAKYAYGFVSDILLPHTPATILIERQRYRSMGSSAVQEWTVRVNMLESMLYAVLETLKKQGRWVGSVYAVTPAKVGPFWLGDNADIQVRAAAKSEKTKNKRAKIDLVGKWLESEQGVKFGRQSEMMGRAFLDKWHGRGQRKGKRRPALDHGPSENITTEWAGEMGKLDDLADCLLQGLAWIRWEENRRRVVKWGPEALTDLQRV